jgi:hypothetical protein
MDVSVLSKPKQRSLRSLARTSVLGDGLLERIRSTTLALLGLTAAIGLAMIALALNQGWPLIAGAPIPGLGNEHQAVDDATVAARARMQGFQPAISAGTGRTSPGVSSGRLGRSRGGIVALAKSQAPQSTDLVVAHPTPAGPAGGSPPEDATPDPASVVQQPAPEPAAAAPVSSSSSPPSPVAQATPEAPIASQAPPATDEGDEHGQGHHSGGHGYGRGHGHSRGGEDSETSEPSESPETAPAPTEAPPPEADEPEESESEQSHASSWGHGGHGHGRW